MNFLTYEDSKRFCALTTYRNGGYSTGPYQSFNLALQVNDNRNDVMKNRLLLSEKLDISQKNFVYMHQTHSLNIKKVTSKDKGKGKEDFLDGVYDTDGLYTFEPNLALVCLHADCVPIIFYHPQAKMVGIIHAGWSGTIKMVTTKMLKEVIEKEKIDPSELEVFLGPSVGPYLLLDDERKKYLELYKDTKPVIIHKDNQTFLDVEAMNINELKALNIKKIKVTGQNTYKDKEKFFSFDRDNKVTGRHASLVFLR